MEKVDKTTDASGHGNTDCDDTIDGDNTRNCDELPESPQRAPRELYAPSYQKQQTNRVLNMVDRHLGDVWPAPPGLQLHQVVGRGTTSKRNS
jgi:hypothetical protein